MDAVHKRTNHWMGEAIADEVSREQIPLCYSSSPPENYGNRLTDIYDVVDVHYMPSIITDEEDEKAFKQSYNGPGGFRFSDMEQYDLKLWGEVWNAACREHYEEMLDRVGADLKRDATELCTTSSGEKLVPIATETFGPCYFPDVEEVDWTWYKAFSADAARILASLPYAGTRLWNYAEPLFRAWDDVDWHRNTNLYVKAMPKLS